MSALFCNLCDVALDLHDGPDSCRLADAKARLLEGFPFSGMTPTRITPPVRGTGG